MIRIANGDILAVTNGTIVLPLDWKGSMDKGLAKQIANAAPGLADSCDLFTHYPVRTKTDRDLLGEVFNYRVDKELWIANCFVQGYRDNRAFTDYRAVKKALSCLRASVTNQHNPYREYASRIAIPWRLGYGLPEAAWNKVMQIIQEVFDPYPYIDVTIYRKDDK